MSGLNQTLAWKPRDKDAVAIADMDPAWRFNTILFLVRRAPRLAIAEGFNELAALRSAPEEVVDDFIKWDEWRLANPVDWIKGTPLVRALALGLPQDRAALLAIAEDARHWSACPGRTGGACSCSSGPGALAGDDMIRLVSDVAQEAQVRADAAAKAAAEAEAVRAEIARKRADDDAWRAANPGIDRDTGRPYGVDVEGVDHNEDHGANDHCEFDSCRLCGGYHCGHFCPDNADVGDLS